MRGKGHRERILVIAKRLFNQQGVEAVTTNHIAQVAEISPGNLYFHFCNKEDIVRHLFIDMTEVVYDFWRPLAAGEARLTPAEFLDELFEIFWSYRFFHREMYALRRRDLKLAKLWHEHIQASHSLFTRSIDCWIEWGLMRPLPSAAAKQRLIDNAIIVASSFLQFYESHNRRPAKKSLASGKSHVLDLLTPYLPEA